MNILIIGASSGIGHRLWRHYASTGHTVVVMARRGGLLDAMVGEYPGNTIACGCDIADTEAFTSVLASLMLDLEHLDMAIVCAGIGELNPRLDCRLEQLTVSVNVAGWVHAVVEVYNILARQGAGHIVAITSVGGLQPAPVAPAYSASKSFQINYIKALQKRSRAAGVTVTEIRPGLVDTRMAKGEGLFWVMPLDKTLRQIVKAIDRKRRLAVVTRRWRLVNFLLRHLC